MRKLIGEGQHIPWWYGIAYRSFDLDAKVAYPVPFHWLVKLCLHVCGHWRKFKNLGRNTRTQFEKEALKAYRQGLEAGLKVGAYGRK